MQQLASLIPSAITSMFQFIELTLKTLQTRGVISKEMGNSAFTHLKYLMVIANVLGLGLSLLLWYRHGQASFSRFRIRGPLKHVAHKEFHCPKTLCAVSVFFPVDEEATRGKKMKMWMNYHHRSGRNKLNIEWQQKARAWFYGKKKPDPTYHLFPWLGVKTPAYDF